MGAFEDFVNAELPKRSGFASVPAGGNATAGTVNVNTGIGLTTAEGSINPAKTVYVSPTDELADYDNLADALQYAETQSISDGLMWFVELDMSAEYYTLENVDLNDGSSGSPAYITVRPRYSAAAGAEDAGAPNTMITVRLSTASSDHALSLYYCNFTFEKIFLSTPNNSVGTLGTDNIQYGIKHQSSTIVFSECSSNIVWFHSLGSGYTFKFTYAVSGGCHLRIYSSYFSVLFITGYGTTGYDHKIFDLTNSSHPSLFVKDSDLSLQNYISDEDIILFDLAPATYSISFLKTIDNTVYLSTLAFCTGENTVFNWGSDGGPINRILGNVFDLSPGASATANIFVYNSVSDAGKVYSKNNIYSQNSGTVNIFQADTGDTIYSDADTFNGTVTKFSGSGSFEENSFVPDAPFTPGDSSDWDVDPTTVQEAIDRIADAVSGLLGGPIP